MDRSDISRLCPGLALSSCHLKRITPSRLAPRILVVALALVLAACASRSGDEITDDGYQVGATVSDEATDEAGEFVVNQALLRHAREELAVLSQPASGGYLETLAASRAPRPVKDVPPPAAATTNQRAGGVQTWADIEAGRGAPVPAAAASGASAASAAVAGTDPTTTAEAADPAAQTAGAPEAEAGAQRPGLFGRMFGWLRPNPGEAAGAGEAGGLAGGAAVATVGAGEAVTDAAASQAAATTPVATAPAAESPVNTVGPVAPVPTPVPAPVQAATTSPTATPIAETVAPVAAVPTSRLPGPGEPGYIVSGHSTGAMSLAPVAALDTGAIQPAPAADAASAAPAAQVATPAGTPMASRPTLAEVEVPAIAPVIVAGSPRPPAGNVIVTPIGNTAQGNRTVPAEAPITTAALRQPAAIEPPAIADVPPLDRTMLERGSFATLMGAMHGMVERCEPPTQMRDQALKTYRATYPAVDLDRNERDNSAARLRFDEEFARSAAATLGSNRVNCDYVRSQSYGWNQLVGDLRHMNRDSARQYRPGLITEISRGAGVGNY